MMEIFKVDYRPIAIALNKKGGIRFVEFKREKSPLLIDISGKNIELAADDILENMRSDVLAMLKDQLKGKATEGVLDLLSSTDKMSRSRYKTKRYFVKIKKKEKVRGT